jgi:hypothetical protein
MAMRSFPTYGPFVELTLNGRGMGSTVKLTRGQRADLRLKIQSPLWFDVDRVEVYRNGELIKIITGKQDCAEGANDCIRAPNNRVVNFDATISDTPDRDAWYVVVVMGLNGKSLAPVYSSTPVARLGMYELIQRLTPLLPPLRVYRVPLSPTMAVVRPYAVTNPIWVDLDGDGLTPVSSAPSWATDRDKQGSGVSSSTSRALSAQPGQHNHDHRQGLGRMARDARTLQQIVATEGISRETVQQALNALRYMTLSH